MAVIIVRAGKVIVGFFLPIIFLSILIYSVYLLTIAEAQLTQPDKTKEPLSAKPVWTDSESLDDIAVLLNLLFFGILPCRTCKMSSFLIK